MKKELVMPLDTIEVLDGELEMVFGGVVPVPESLNAGVGCGCGCGSGCGCGCGAGCGCGCSITTEAPM